MNLNQSNDYTKRLQYIRQFLKDQHLDALWIPMADPFHHGSVLEEYQYVKWLSGFQGSAGQIIITPDHAVFMTDGRYTAMAANQIDTANFEIIESHPHVIERVLEKHIKPSGTLGFDPWLHTVSQIEKIQPFLNNHSIELKSISLDILKSFIPKSSNNSEAFLYSEKYAGSSFKSKCDQISKIIHQQKLDGFLLTQADSICWLLNVRGNDLPCVPIILSYAFIWASGKVDWFVERSKIPHDIQQFLKDNVYIHSIETVTEFLKQHQNKCIGIDPQSTSYQIHQILMSLQISVKYQPDPCLVLKACKNETEIDTMRTVHIRDGAIVTRFLYWLYQQPPTSLTELSTSAKLNSLRREDPHFWNLSFETISAIDAHSALPHYHPSTDWNISFKPGSVYLVDSGGQYGDGGTTDITRTLMIPGADNPHIQSIKDKYTRVLKGHISLFITSFPIGTTGVQVDAIARQYLWQAQTDFNHATGHGIGCFLNVHESPPYISRRGHTPIQPGMIISNEPGYYELGKFGIRLENVMVATECDSNHMIKFENLTWAPYDLTLIDWDLITTGEKEWLIEYYQQLVEKIRPFVTDDIIQWIINSYKMHKLICEEN